MLATGFSGFHDEFVQSFRLVLDELAAAKAIDGQSDPFIEASCLYLDRMVQPIRIPERDSTREFGS
jgi:hypothetical protein